MNGEGGSTYPILYGQEIRTLKRRHDMANMSYCRFQNTLQDLKDCWEHIDDEDLSFDELKARNKLILVCSSIAENFEENEND
jgi:hypothetical protein